MIVGIVVALLAAALLVLAIAFFLLSSNKPFTAGTLPEEIEHVLEEVEKEPHKEGQKLHRKKDPRSPRRRRPTHPGGLGRPIPFEGPLPRLRDHTRGEIQQSRGTVLEQKVD
eukprot:TRINITY_DN8585_c0_g2_i1.p3 TRINITY_DN8585_c0_g2~~TRINITY_DN8585_c0_g2_i1.p3  ORF type:complete len:129 (+),score=32.60 TRINITY_DN8585_c0_g2_i1:52-387(+)